jgi:hypothetical protein
LGDAERQAMDTRLTLVEPGVGVLNLLGVLDLEPELSLAQDGQRVDMPDPLLMGIALPLPKIGAGGAVSKNVLPGAPEAFFNNAARLFVGQEDVQRFDSNEYFTKVVKDSWKKYFYDHMPAGPCYAVHLEFHRDH